MKTAQASKSLSRRTSQVASQAAFLGSPKRIFSIGEAAIFLGVSIDTLRNWEKQGKISPRRSAGGIRKFKLSDLQKLQKSTPSLAEKGQTIGEAAIFLGVSIDTLRNWEKQGKISSQRSAAGIRKFKLSDLQKLRRQNTDSSQKVDHIRSIPLTNLSFPQLRKSFTGKIDSLENFFLPHLVPYSQSTFTSVDIFIKNQWQTFQNQLTNQTNLAKEKRIIHNNTIKIYQSVTKHSTFLALCFLFICVIIASFFSLKPLTESKIVNTPSSNVLAESTSAKYLEVNSDINIKGDLGVEGKINGIALDAGANDLTFTDPLNSRSLTVTATQVALDQNLSTSSSPTFASLNINSLNSSTLSLSAAKDQLILASGGITGTLTWTPTSTNKTITLPNITDTLVGKTTTDTLSNKTIKSGDSNTISGSFPDITGITSLGTVSTGTWNGTKISTGYGGTGLSSYTKGDLLYSSASDTLAKLSIGTSGQVLKVASTGIPEWGAGTTDLGSGVSGTLTVASGGTGATTLTQYGVLYGNGSSAVSATSAPSSGQLLVGNSSGVPAFVSLSGDGTLSSTGVLTIGTGVIGNTELEYDTGQALTTASSPTFTGLTLSGSVSSNLLPATNDTYDLGSSSYQWQDGWFAGTLTVAGNIVGASTGTSGYWTRSNSAGTLYTGTTTDKVGIGTTTPSSQVEIKAASSNTALTLKGASTGSNNIFEILNNAGDTTYFSINSTGSMSGSAFQLTDSAKAIIGTAVPGAWTNIGGVAANDFTYRRAISVTATGNLASNFEVTLNINSASTANQIYSNTNDQTDPYKDLRLFYTTDSGSSYTEIARNVTTFSSSQVTFTFQLQAQINDGSTSSTNYYLFYDSPNYASLTTPSTYTGDLNWDSHTEATTNWTSGDSAYPLTAASSPAPQAGSYSLKSVAMVDRIGSFSTTGTSNPTVYKHASIIANSGGNDYLYIVGGKNTSGGADQSTINYAQISTGTVGTFATTGTSNPTVSDSSLATAQAADGGDGSDGSLDLSQGSGAGGCTGTGLSWNAGSSTCTIATATKSTFNFTTINVPNGTTLTTSGTTFPTLKASGDVTITGTGKIDLAGKGNGAGAGTGTGGAGATSNGFYGGGGGGGYGGAGGRGEDGDDWNGWVDGGIAGSTYATTSVGSGGGNGQAAGGAGGGGMKISSGGSITVSGTIDANGATGSSAGGGGGSGGRVWLIANSNITVSGTVRANGGTGGDASGSIPNCQGAGGGGGGGYITIEYAGTLNTSGSTITASAGAKGTNACYLNGANGAAGSSTQSTLSSYIYIIGGKNSTTAQSAINKTAINSNGTLGTFAATTQGIQVSGIATPRHRHTSFTQTASGTTYIYVVGGYDSNDTAQGTIYRGTVASAGDITSDFTSVGTSVPIRADHAQVVLTAGDGNKYMYIVGGKDGSGTAQSTIYKAQINTSDGTIGTFAATTAGLPTALYGLGAISYTGPSSSVQYIYFFGGKNSSDADNSTVYRATVSSNGDISTIESTGQTALSTAVYEPTIGSVTQSGTTYLYVIGGINGTTVQSTISKPTFTSDMTNFYIEKKISDAGIDLSNKNDITFSFYSSSTAAGLMEVAFSEDTSSPTYSQTTTFTASLANTWESKDWDISGISSANKNSVKWLRFKVNSAQSAEFTTYIDNIQAQTEATGTDTTTAATQTLGSANLTLNAQGTGLVRVNYADLTDANYTDLAGSSGMIIYNGATTPLFTVASTGAITATGAISGLTGITSSGTVTLSGLGTGVVQANSSGVLSNVLGTTNYLPKWSATGLATTSLLYDTGTNVGIGTTTPGSALNISGGVGIGSSYATIAAPTNGLIVSGNVGIGTSVAGSALQVNGAGVFGYSASTVGPTNGLAVSGRVGIGSTDTTEGRLLIQQTADTNVAGLTLFNELGGRSLRLWADANNISRIDSGGTAAGNLSINGEGAGRVGIGTTNPGYALQVGNAGDGTEARANAWNALSDIRLKSNIATLSGALNKVLALNGITFDWISTGQHSLGFIAQDVEKVVPEIVSHGDDGYLSIDYGKFTPLLVEGMKELDLRISSISGQLISASNPSSISFNIPTPAQKDNLVSELKDQLASLSARLAETESRIKNLESSGSAVTSPDTADTNAQSEITTASANLTLTDLSTLLATSSASPQPPVYNLNTTSDATISGTLTVYDGIFQNTLKSLGEALLGKTVIAGDLTVDGTMAVTANSISSFGTLYIQTSPFSDKLDLFNGKVIIDNLGKISVQKIEVSPQTLGTGVIPAGSIKITTLNPLITQRSKIFITSHKPVLMGVTKTDPLNKSFTVELGSPQNQEIIFDWWIIDVHE